MILTSHNSCHSWNGVPIYGLETHTAQISKDNPGNLISIGTHPVEVGKAFNDRLELKAVRESGKELLKIAISESSKGKKYSLKNSFVETYS